VAPGSKSFCDALLLPTPGVMTFAINRATLAGGLAVSDDEVARAMEAAFTHLKLVAEPGGAVALAAVLARKFDARGKTVAVVMSGGNVDAATFTDALKRAAAK
jgi:threonine dehydratase